MYARVGYAEPTEVWQPDPAVYADLTWPPVINLPPTAALGQQVYIQRCAVCHGPDGRGNGPAAPSLIPRPRDFTLGDFKYKSTLPGQPPTDADLVNIVAQGLQASAMPYWRDLLSDEETSAVVAYIKGLSPVFRVAAPEAIVVPPRVRPDEVSIARGRKLFVAQGCVACHGPDGRGGTMLTDAKGYPVMARDLTAPWTFRGRSDPEAIWLRLTTGLSPGPMPSYANRTTPEQRWDLVNYVLSLARIPPWEPGGKLGGPGQQADPVKRGEYLVHAEMCGLCHTQINRTGIYRDDYYLAGGMRIEAYPHGVFVSRNLTSDPETGLGNWTEAQIAKAIRNGRAPNRTLNPWGMPWNFLHGLSEEDALAIGSYLKRALPAVHNRIPAPLHYGIVETIMVKLTRPLPAVNPEVLVYADGNFGQTKPGLPRDLPQKLLIGGQWLVLIAGVVAFVLAGPAEDRFPRRAGGWILSALVILGILILGLIELAIYRLPALGIIPPEQVANSVLRAIPEAKPALLRSPEQRALAERGQYLFTVASCALCHDPTGEGGDKISMRPGFGTLWTRNITPDLATGIGNWGDAEIARAIRSGVTPDGRMLHWQGMTWDHASNWDEEDIRALIIYLRTLPPVEREIPPARPPSPDDCQEYTFWVAESERPGCR
jgi:mono/diheme cytochrome c family protein